MGRSRKTIEKLWPTSAFHVKCHLTWNPWKKKLFIKTDESNVRALALPSFGQSFWPVVRCSFSIFIAIIFCRCRHYSLSGTQKFICQTFSGRRVRFDKQRNWSTFYAPLACVCRYYDAVDENVMSLSSTRATIRPRNIVCRVQLIEH